MLFQLMHDSLGWYPFFIMIGGEVTCIESMEGAEVFGEKIYVLKLAALKQMSQPFDWQLYMYIS